MTLIAAVEALATLLWCYAGLTMAAWLWQARRLDKRSHIPAVTELLGHLVPAMILLVVVVLFGALVGLPSVVVLIAILFPAGLAYGSHMALADLTEAHSASAHLPRAFIALALATAITIWRMSA